MLIDCLYINPGPKNYKTIIYVNNVLIKGERCNLYCIVSYKSKNLCFLNLYYTQRNLYIFYCYIIIKQNLFYLFIYLHILFYSHKNTLRFSINFIMNRKYIISL